jgi:hypothetical protein
VLRFALRTVGFASGFALIVGLSLGAGCSEQARLSVEGPTPYARCLGRASGEAAAERIGGLGLSVEQGVLSIVGLPKVPRLAVFSGPGPGPAAWAAAAAGKPGDAKAQALQALAAAKPSLVLVLGELGDDARLASATAAALNDLGVPVLILGGGRDSLESLAAADSLSNVVDVSPLRAVRLVAGKGPGPASYSLLPVAGALDGRYARSKHGCGYAEADLDDRAPPKAEPGERRMLVAWQAPSGSKPPAADDAGSAALADYAQAHGATAGLFAWPHAQAGRPRASGDGNPRALGMPIDDLSLVVPRLAGPALELSDGSRLLPGFALVELGPDGPVVRELARRSRAQPRSGV